MYRVILVLAILSACAQQAAKHAESVPAELVPPGYSAAECRLVDDSGGGGFSNVGAAMDAGAHTQQRAECNHITVKP
jgi:hypothetical protein